MGWGGGGKRKKWFLCMFPVRGHRSNAFLDRQCGGFCKWLLPTATPFNFHQRFLFSRGTRPVPDSRATNKWSSFPCPARWKEWICQRVNWNCGNCGYKHRSMQVVIPLWKLTFIRVSPRSSRMKWPESTRIWWVVELMWILPAEK